MKTSIGSDEVSSPEVPILDLLVQHSYPVKDDHFFCPCICNLMLEVREGPSKCVKPSPCVMYIQMPANNDSYLRRHFCT